MDNRLKHLAGLGYFEVAARLRSYSAAATELFISQAAVSQKIRQLEEGLGCKLFVRQGREMQLTKQGETLYHQVSSGFEKIITGLNQIQSEPVEGVLCVRTPPSFASRWLMPRLWKFTMEHPYIPIRLITDCDTPNIRHTSIDVAIWQGDEEVNDPGLHQEMLFEEPVYPFCSPELANSMKFSEPEQLLNCWLIHFDSQSFSWSQWFRQASVVMAKDTVQWMEVSTFDMALNAVIAGHGACLATDSLADDFVARGLLVKPFSVGLTPGVRYSLISDPSSSRAARIEAFNDWLRRELRQQAPL
ncbi:LysR family transcriptional regulator [Vibrio fluvialis]|uniref:LysR substrate-binding domain-containing protein n=1 Tax=Vibrio fluvialis TaxID=676 RepID=UPI001C9CFD14|nr:LysR substrate-binding domain-containing protein [Vibrio fluvialis]MBY7886734.1 LysR family transcriptional regulator [Vibrio fluvialis]MBY7995218.1 LysR family transcriptional regulator [Vibrio fluvialis]MBY8087137.1 LysR family transcriptional regulator [Vibrio fluvialis]MBY8106759.1 LysR family transcriptional regulator [Vibrio fluvialis]MBY8201844.1 LysR family transcriptional regulator [Vibrio fluvialis]